MRLTQRLSLAAFGLTALVAVTSYWWQLPGLGGSHGIAPLALGVDGLRRAGLSFTQVPTLLWVSASDGALHAVCALATLASLALVAGLAPRWAALTLWAAWLSLARIGVPFLAFQWDMLLVEGAFFMACFAPGGLRPFHRRRAPPPPGAAVRFAMAWLACKVTLGSGLVKLASGDPTWRDLTALTYHWWSQPLPTWTSVLLHELPLDAQRVLCALVFVLELPIPLMALGPRPLRLLSAGGLIALQLALLGSGNYSYYNVLTLVLALPLLDDAALRRLVGVRVTVEPTPRSRWWQWGLVALVVEQGVEAFTRRRLHVELLEPVSDVVGRFDTINTYGAFAFMTTSRPEILLEGSDDGVTWLLYELPWKPGRLERRPDFVAPWHPRLDWQLWFAALGRCEHNPWLVTVHEKLLRAQPEVLALFAVDLFHGRPPRVVRTRVFEYRFAPWSQPGVWWTRTETGPYCPPLTLSPDGRLVRADRSPE